MQPFPVATTATAPSPRSPRNIQTENNSQYDMATERGLYSTISIIHSVYYLFLHPTHPKKNPQVSLTPLSLRPAQIYMLMLKAVTFNTCHTVRNVE
jgi:hypothetical protein